MLQEIIMQDRIYITGKVKDVIKYLKNYQQEFSTIQELINRKLS